MRKIIFTTGTQRHREEFKCIRFALCSVLLSMCLGASVIHTHAQETAPLPGAPKSGQIPPVHDKKLPNGLTVAVGERHTIPLVTVQLLVKSAAADENIAHAGVADMTASLLTKGTRTRTATQVAEAIEALGGSISSGAGWNTSTVSVTITADKVDQALAILSDVVLNPAFKQEELDLLRSQYMDSLTYNLKQPGFLATYAASRYTFGEHPAGGTPESLKAITRNDIVEFHKTHYTPQNSVLIFAGDITQLKANALATKFFGKWKGQKVLMMEALPEPSPNRPDTKNALRRILVIDLPNSGQAAVKYARRLDVGRTKCILSNCNTSEVFFPATVMNSVLGGGYSSRLNQEIRIKRGLSYGAGSSVAWRAGDANFSTSTQTKTESAAEVAELVLKEIDRLASTSTPSTELDPRKLVLTGGFGQDLETTAGLAGRIGDLYAFEQRPSELNTYNTSVRSVTDAQIRSFSSSLRGGDVVIAGDAKLFLDDLKKRFPDMMINVIPGDQLDLANATLRK
jgi:zinc protease